MKQTTLLFLFLCFSTQSLSQKFRFNQYTTEDGISQDFIYSINQDKNGYLWVGTGEGLCRFDGKTFTTYTTKDGLAENVITSSFMDVEDAQWFGHNSGSITLFKNGKFQLIKDEAILKSKINSICGKANEIYVLSQNEGLFEVRENHLVALGDFEMESFHSLQMVDQKNLLAGTSEGLIHLKKKGEKWIKAALYLEDEWISSIAKSQNKGRFLIGTQSGMLFRASLKNGTLQLKPWEGDYDLSNLQIQTILQDKEMNIWLGTYGKGLIKLHTDSTGRASKEVTLYNEQSGLPNDFVQSVFQDRENNIWIGTFGAGLCTLIDDFFTFYSHQPGEIGNNVLSIAIDDQDKWFGVENGLIRISPQLDKKWEFYHDQNGFTNDKVTSLLLHGSVLWIGTASNGLYTFNRDIDQLKKIRLGYGSLEKRINQITAENQRIWIATEGGLIVYDTNSGNSNLFGTEDGLAHNSIKTVFKDHKGIIWMGTHSRYIYAIKDATIEEHQLTNSGELEVVSISEDKNNNLWVATAESGVFKKTDNSVSHYTAKDGLKSNYTYAIQVDSKGNIWVGHRGALSRISKNEEKIQVFDHNSGVNGQVNPNALFLDEKNYLWIGTDRGAIRYDPSKDKNEEIAPVINLLKVQVGEKMYPINQKIELPYDHYRVQFEFIGISFKDPENVKYKYKLEGHDKVFSNYTKENTATYGKLTDGEYTFTVTACTENGACATEKASIQIVIAKPFWKKWWFFAGVILGLFAGVTIFIRLRLKRLRDNQVYLEEQLAIKTKEVVEKAEVIQQINKDLTASINYAERIQSAMLPQIDGLTGELPASFIFFRPRDVVSGDFYFLHKYQDKLIVACVDCTGHGVPGGFMSMIGSTTLRNIYTLMESTGNWLDPAQVLDKLDEEVQKILHQRDSFEKNDFFKSRDGMDMTLAEINLKTKEVQLAAAKRHSFLIQNKEVKLLSGDKRPIGGGEFGKVDFSTQTYKMNTGDTLFLFSDGYSDQFGGHDGRKLKLMGVQKIMEQLCDKNPVEYGHIIQKEFDDWKGDLEQIDDVLMIGIVF
ncbi:MAG: two-component regulator propeller domain-containing protein [Crocinitomicaceae bacterium]